MGVEPDDLRVARGSDDVQAAARALGVAPGALATTLTDPGLRLLVGDGGGVALLRRGWAADGHAEAVLVARRDVRTTHPAVTATAAGWGCERVRDGLRDDVSPVAAPPDDAPTAERFLHLAALAATRVEVAVALARDTGRDTTKSDGSPSLGADEAAHLAAAHALRPLGVTVLSEERSDRPVSGDEPWVVLDPLDGTGNFRAGLAPWAFSAALVQGGRAVAGLVADLSSGRRWSGALGVGARRDGVPVRPRDAGTVVAPTAPSGSAVQVPRTARRVRVTGCTAVDVCLVADGAAGAWQNLDRSGTHVHDVAGGLALLAAAGGVALDRDGQPLELSPDTETLIRFVAAGTEERARELLRELA
ncbi:inositol monophosphatase family protein [Geodermatophilus sp. DSM 44513]|uniref:inositol monophosphatase family protein n=1 Tax=Geodermatophilus sp. DSM 44513 TaxID=1528104 RepID=UPI0028F72BA6|nr:inositol monophosphatase family protein [Geodermatophilus sp. DSM 44513]WNV76342.1 inositol monophosphatase family protein [Geodermatophilus sp. DSM 44513]